MEIKIEDVELLVPKKVPGHGKVSGIKSESGIVKVLIPRGNPKISIRISNAFEIIHRSVTSDGKILGLTNYSGQKIYVIGQTEETAMEGMLSLELSDEINDRILAICEHKNIDPPDYLHNLLLEADLQESSSQRDKSKLIRNIIKQLHEKNEGKVPIKEVIIRAVEAGITKEKTEEIIERLRKEGSIYMPTKGFLKQT